jgi:hypothetical protein
MTRAAAHRGGSHFRSSLCLIALATLAFPACRRTPERDDGPAREIFCTTELRVAVNVRISSPTRVPVTAITAFNEIERPCKLLSPPDETSPTVYYCTEQGGGRYAIRVRSGPVTWTKVVSVDADECHVTGAETAVFWLDPAIAD